MYKKFSVRGIQSFFSDVNHSHASDFFLNSKATEVPGDDTVGVVQRLLEVFSLHTAVFRDPLGPNFVDSIMPQEIAFWG